MKTHSLVQGSAEWHAYRAQHFNASDAPAMMGCSAYKTRTQLLHEMHTGLTPDVDAATQRRFDDGHKFEAMARPLAETIIGMELYPVTGSKGKQSASFDGLTMCETIDFEHKSLNAELRECITDEACGQLLPLQYRVQMEQQLYVSGAEKCLFMASKWQGEDLVEERHTWYYPDLELRQKILDGWIQFEADLAAYVPQATEAKAVATPQFGLPSVSIQVNGSIALIDNLQAFGTALTAYVEKINLKPETDQDFADLEATVKTLKNAEDALDAAETGALAQTESIDAMRRTVAMYRETARTNRLLVDKLVKVEKENRKTAIVKAAFDQLVSHVRALNDRIGSSLMPIISSDFPGVVKGLKSIDSMRDRVNTELARCKIEANAIADTITANLKAINAHSDFEFLFFDKGYLVLKDAEFVAMAVKNRIADHQAKEAARIEAETARIRAEEVAKLAREQAERDRVAKEEEDRIKAEAVKAEAAAQAALIKAQEVPAVVSPVEPVKVARLAAVAAKPEARNPRAELNELLDQLGDDQITRVLSFVKSRYFSTEAA